MTKLQALVLKRNLKRI